MVTIHRKEHLAASWMVLLAYSFFFLLHVASGSYDYDASGRVESTPEKLDETYIRLSNHEGGHLMRMSRSTQKNDSLKEPLKEKEETSELVTNKKAKRSVILDTIDNVAGLIEQEKTAEAEMEKTDAINQRMVKDKPVENNLDSVVGTRITGSNIKKDPKELKPEIDENDEAALRHMIISEPLLDDIKAAEHPSHDIADDDSSLSMRFAPTDILKEILKLKGKLHLPGGKKDEKDFGSESWANGEDDDDTDDDGMDDDYDYDYDYDSDEDDYDSDEDDDDSDEDDDGGHKEKTAIDPPIADKKDPIAAKDSQGLDSFDQETLNGTMSLYKLIADVFIPKQTNCTDERPHPWRALTSSQYARQVSKGKGPNSSRTTKETKSKLSLIIGRDPVMDRAPEKILLQTQPKIDNITETTSSNVPNHSEIGATSVKPSSVPDLGNTGQTVKQPTDGNLDPACRILDSAVIILTKTQDARDQPNSNWWY